MNVPKILLITIVVILICIALATACAPVTVSDVNSKIESTVSGNMKLIGQQQDIQVWSVVDGLSGTVCYITVNKQIFLPAAIFCIDK